MPATVLTGIVTKAGVMAKTVTMTVEKIKMHPKLLKYLVHDPDSTLRIGERISAQACRPLSARKRFTLLERLGFKDMPVTHGEGGAEADQLRRLKADAAMSAEQRERLRIEQRVKNEMRGRP